MRKGEYDRQRRERLTGGRNVSLWVSPIQLDHEVAVLLICARSLAGINASKELRERLSLNVCDRVHVKPISCLRWQAVVLRLHCGIISSIAFHCDVQWVDQTLFCRVFDFRYFLVQLLCQSLALQCLSLVCFIELYTSKSTVSKRAL